MALAALLAVLASSAQPATKAPARRAYPAKCISGDPRHGGKLIFRELRSLGVRVWSDGLSWAAVAPRRPADPRSPDDPAYRWSPSFERALNAARAQGIEPVIYVNGFPSWANGGRDQRWAPRDPNDYADFMAAAVARYPQVRRWIVFAEPGNVINFMPQGAGGKTAPRIYARLLDAAYVAMHSVRRDVVAIGGTLQPSGSDDGQSTAADTFLRNMVLPGGRRPRLDMFGMNPYTERRLDLALPKRPRRVDFDDLDWLTRRLDRLWPHRHLRIFIDEFGWNTEHEGLGWLYYVSRKKQAANLRKAYALAAKFGRVDTMCWFLLYDAPPQRNSTQWLNWTTGLRTWEGVRKPSWYAFAHVPRGRRPVGVGTDSRPQSLAPPQDR